LFTNAKSGRCGDGQRPPVPKYRDWGPIDSWIPPQCQLQFASAFIHIAACIGLVRLVSEAQGWCFVFADVVDPESWPGASFLRWYDKCPAGTHAETLGISLSEQF
jgi:hypothetical protein